MVFRINHARFNGSSERGLNLGYHPSSGRSDDDRDFCAIERVVLIGSEEECVGD